MDTTILLIALVSSDAVALRSAPSDLAPAHQELWPGDWLEVRGERAGFLKVYDRVHERAGYVRPGGVRLHELGPGSAETFRTLTAFHRDELGKETLGIAYAALYLRAADGGAIASAAGAEVFGALGTMADRLARRLSAARTGQRADVLAGHRRVAEGYGIAFVAQEREDRTVLCYDGDGFRQLLANPRASLSSRARAALALTDGRCRVENSGPAADRVAITEHLKTLDAVDPAALPRKTATPETLLREDFVAPFLVNRLNLRRAALRGELGFLEARVQNLEAASELQIGAEADLRRVAREELSGDDEATFHAVSVAVGAGAGNRLADAPRAEAAAPGAHQVQLRFVAGGPGETCVELWAGATAAPAPLVRRCTHGLVWRSSATWARRRNAVALSVGLLPGWSELWVLRRTESKGVGGASEASAPVWKLDVITPATSSPDSTRGYVQAAGFTPEGDRILLGRHVYANGRRQDRYEVMSLTTMTVDVFAQDPARLLAFRKWAVPGL